MFTGSGQSVRALAGIGVAVFLALPVGAEPLLPEPRDRSTPETIGFQSVADERMSDTAIMGALAPTSAGEGMDEDRQVVEPVYFTEEYMQDRDMEREDTMLRREYLLNNDGMRGSGPAQVRPRAFQNRVYGPSSSVSTEHRPRQ